jgi:multiple sugar transport system permease protein
MSLKTSMKKSQAIEGLLSVTPIIVILLLIRAYPLFEAFIKSFTNWDGLSKNQWIGFANYAAIFSSGEFWLMLRNNIILLLHIPIQVILGLFFSVLLYEQVWGWKFFRSVSFLPQIVSAVIIGYLFRVFFSFDGPVNTVLRTVGLDSLAIEWMRDGLTALCVIIFCLVWSGIGWQSLIILGGMSSIPPSIFDAAKVDGANYWQRTFKIVLPMLVRVIEFSFVVTVVWVFTGLFPFIYTMTKGGPGYETTTIDYMIYLKAFVSGTRLGSACAVAVILLVIILIFTKAQMAVANRADNWSE